MIAGIEMNEDLEGGKRLALTSGLCKGTPSGMDAPNASDPLSPAGGGASQTLKEITQRLVAEFGPERIILFGSHAWGQPGENSDIDLLVVVPESDLPPPRRAARAYRCLREVPVPLDILIRTREEVERSRHLPASLIHEVLERGRVLYG